MQGMFRANGGCGYVKKPQILMHKHQCDNEFDPTRVLQVKKTLKVKHISLNSQYYIFFYKQNNIIDSQIVKTTWEIHLCGGII